MASRIETGLQIKGLSGDTNSLYVIGDSSINGNVDITGKTSNSTDYGLRVRNSGGTDNMVVRNDGNVGIGTSSPDTKLHVKSTYVPTYGNLAIDINAQSYGWMSIVDGAARKGYFGWNGVDNFISLGSETGYGLEFYVNGNTGVNRNLVVTSSGYVGLGTNYLPSTSMFTIKNNNVSNNIQEWKSNANDLKAVINDTGNVGIGITSPTAKLHINNTGSTNTVLFEDDTNPDSSPFVVSNAGRVGIGMTTPTAKLHISGETTGTTQYTLKLDDSSGNGNLWVRDDGVVFYGNGGGSPAKFISAGPSNSTFVSVGYNVLNNFTQNSSSGNGVVGFGMNVFQYLPSNKEGVGFGYNVFNNSSLNSNRNIGFGTSLGAGVTTGTQNLIFGYNTANNFTTGNKNIQMAHQVGGANLSETLAFGHDFTLSGSNSIHFGRENQYNTVYWGTDTTGGGFAGAPNFTERLMSVGNGIGLFNFNGKNWIFEGSRSTGQGTGGSFIWRTTPSGVTSADTQNTLVEAMRITGEGNIGIGTSSPTANLDISGSTGYNQLRLRTSFTPTSSGDTSGNVGDVSWDNDYVYVKTFSGWGRTQLSYSF